MVYLLTVKKYVISYADCNEAFSRRGRQKTWFLFRNFSYDRWGVNQIVHRLSIISRRMYLGRQKWNLYLKNHSISMTLFVNEIYSTLNR